MTTLLCFNSSASSSASPHEQFLQALFLRGAPALNGSQVGIGRSRSAGVRSASASIEGVEGELSVHKAFFEDLRSGSSRRRGNAIEVGAAVADLCLSENDAPDDKSGFCAIMVPSSGRADRILNPARVSSEGRVKRPEDRLRRCRVPKGVKPENIGGRKVDSLGSRLS